MLIRSAHKFSQAVLNFAFPPKCLSCPAVVEKHGHICETCWDTITLIGVNHCYRCGIPFEFNRGKKAVCEYCAYEKPKFNRARAFCTYDGAARQLAISLKFGDNLHLAPPMAKMMHIMGQDLVDDSDMIVPVPLHYRRRIGRRYNQSSLLALHISKLSGKSFEPFLLRRNRSTRQQTLLTKIERQKNVSGAFSVTRPLAGQTILLVDDVMTTGATLSACAKALKEAGAKKVYCLVFARTMVF